MARQTSKRTVRVARKLRREMSLPEVLLWQRLRHAEVKIRKQHPCGPYVLDFYCAAAKLAIEIDGIAHDMGERLPRDEAREASACRAMKRGTCSCSSADLPSCISQRPRC